MPGPDGQLLELAPPLRAGAIRVEESDNPAQREPLVRVIAAEAGRREEMETAPRVVSGECSATTGATT